MSNYNATVIECQLDWLTGTTTDATMGEGVYLLGQQFLLTQSDLGNKRQPWSWRGYFGEHCGAVTWGHRINGQFIQLSGPTANTHGLDVWRATRHVTRVDAQVTVHHRVAAVDVAKLLYNRLASVSAEDPWAPKPTLFQKPDGGQTLYIGSPKSEQRARIYDKYAESQNDSYRNCWRYEVQFRGEYANDFMSRWAVAEHPEAVIAGVVHLWFSTRGIAMPWDYVVGVLPKAHHPNQNDVDKRLGWLATQVRPVVAWLVSKGEYDRTRAVLGLPDGGNHRVDIGDLGDLEPATADA